MFKEAESGDKEINIERIEEALEMSPSIIATGCPFCNTMLTDGVKLKNRSREVKVMDLAEKILQFLSEINAGEDAVNYINDYIHYRVKYESGGSERKLSGMFSSAFNPTKVKEYGSDKCFKIFKATVFSIRNEALPKAEPGWLITDVEDIDWIGEVVSQETELF